MHAVSIQGSALLLALTTVSLLAPACASTTASEGGDSATSDGDDDDGDVADPPIGGFEWFDCPGEFVSRCARVPVPLDHFQPDGAKIEVLISRLPARQQPATRQLWLLRGGPGESGEVFSDVAQEFANAAGDLDVYVLEHRGVGESTRLECPVQEALESDGGFAITDAELPACLAALHEQWGPGMVPFTTTSAAQDLNYVLRAIQGADATSPQGSQAVYLYGEAYGAWWALRYLQLADAIRPAGVMLDSLIAPGQQWLSDFDTQFDPVLAELMTTHCAADEVCHAKLGPDAWARVQAVVAAMSEGHCAELGLDPGLLRQVAALLLIIPVDVLRGHLAPLFYRLERCNEGDVAVLAQYFTTLLDVLSQGPTERSSFSLPLQRHLTLSELWEQPPPSVTDLVAACEQSIACPYTAVSMGVYYDLWPRYPRDPLAGQWPLTDVPVLTLSGGLDAQTPHQTASTVVDYLAAPHQHYVQVPTASHTVMLSSPVRTPGAPTCGMQMMHRFIADPLAVAIDTACLGDLVPVNFTDTSDIGAFLFGGDVWENRSDARGPVTRPDWNRLIEVLQRGEPATMAHRLKQRSRSSSAL
ncbi:MAG: hypothetical protein B7733_15205 [Myxococcales bacterium FL481]|nr:MAG: hypothetical protein B7733_15205 [Myxococcales bacterium FL481]